MFVKFVGTEVYVFQNIYSDKLKLRSYVLDIMLTWKIYFVFMSSGGHCNVNFD